VRHRPRRQTTMMRAPLNRRRPLLLTMGCGRKGVNYMGEREGVIDGVKEARGLFFARRTGALIWRDEIGLPDTQQPRDQGW
jgi:hypothetical protein